MKNCFETKEQLKTAVNACASSSDQSSQQCQAAKKVYGWPMNLWCFGDTITDMEELFKDKADFNEASISEP